MSLLKPTVVEEEINQKLRFKKSLLNEIQDYCKWSGILSENHFFEEAALFVLKKDKTWQKAKADH